MKDELKYLVNTGQWQQAYEGLQDKWDIFDDETAIYGAAVYFNQEMPEEAYRCIRKGLQYNDKNYELWLLLGNYYERKNSNQAYLCYENAAFYCDNPEDEGIILQFKHNAANQADWNVRPAAILVMSEEHLEMTRMCLESIRKQNPPSSYDIIVVDNASEEPITDWLKTQNDIFLICNGQKEDLAVRYNQGIEAADPESDIFLLDNDSVLMPNSLFWLRMGLYEEDSVGAVGSVSNRASNFQQIKEQYHTWQQYDAYAVRNNLPTDNPYEEKYWLDGFAVLMKRPAIEQVGRFDTGFSSRTNEQHDMGLRLKKAGFAVRLCYNSFIYHHGIGNRFAMEVDALRRQESQQHFEKKWGFPCQYYGGKNDHLISLMIHPHSAPIRVLEVGCGLGGTILGIKHLWPNAEIYGIELNEKVAGLASHSFHVMQGNIEHMDIPYEKGTFHYIIFGDVLEHLYDPQQTLKNMTPYLMEGGHFLCSIPNIGCIAVIADLIKGRFDYQDAGILDRTHIRFFTLKSIVDMLETCGLTGDGISPVQAILPKEQEALMEYLRNIPGGNAGDVQLRTVQYFFRAKRVPGQMNEGQFIEDLDGFLAAGQNEAATHFFYDEMGRVKFDDRINTLSILFEFYEQQKKLRERSVFDGRVSVAEVMAYYHKLKFLLRRYEFGIQDGDAEFVRFIKETHTGAAAIVFVIKKSIIDKTAVFHKAASALLENGEEQCAVRLLEQAYEQTGDDITRYLLAYGLLRIGCIGRAKKIADEIMYTDEVVLELKSMIKRRLEENEQA